MADFISLIASILQLVDTVAKTRNYVHDFRNAPKDQRSLLLEIQSLQNLVDEPDLNHRIKNSLTPGRPSNGGFEGPLNQLKEEIQQLTKKLDKRGLRPKARSLFGYQDGYNDIETDISSALGDYTKKQGVDHDEDQRDYDDQTLYETKSKGERGKRPHYFVVDILNSVRDVARSQQDDLEAKKRDNIIKWYSRLNFFLRQSDVFSTRQPGEPVGGS
ncbi:hypothetical protein B0H13DRAFT_1899678 [Mycena leptocephala]|nr:hypothetical protein B0H13DRAFT_1899678 [Mycena leptocephala]